MSVKSCTRRLHGVRSVRPALQLAPDSFRRTFIPSMPSSEPTIVTASRILPYAPFPVFGIIADVQSYSKFLPFIQASEVLQESPRPDAHHGKKWPALATLKVGFKENISEAYTSRVYCVPPISGEGESRQGFVEAVSGSEAPQPTFTAQEGVGHYDIGAESNGPDGSDGPLAYLKTRWTIGRTTGSSALPSEEATPVHLAVEFRFKSPIYELMSKAATPKVAEMMIDAFEKRVRDVLGPSQG